MRILGDWSAGLLVLVAMPQFGWVMTNYWCARTSVVLPNSPGLLHAVLSNKNWDAPLPIYIRTQKPMVEVIHELPLPWV